MIPSNRYMCIYIYTYTCTVRMYLLFAKIDACWQVRKRVGRIGKFAGIFSTAVYFISRRNWSMLNFPPARRYRYRPWIPFLPFRRGFSLSKGRIFYEISMKFRIQRIYIYIYIGCLGVRVPLGGGFAFSSLFVTFDWRANRERVVYSRSIQRSFY